MRTMEILTCLMFVVIGALMVVFPKAVWKFRKDMRDMPGYWMGRETEEREPSRFDLIFHRCFGIAFLLMGLAAFTEL